MNEIHSRRSRFHWWLTRNRAWVLTGFIALTIVMGAGVFRIKSEVILSDLFPYDHPYVNLHARFAQVFGGGGTSVLIAVKAEQGDIFNKKTLEKIKDISDEVVLWPEVYRLLTSSIATYNTKVVTTKARGVISMETLMYPDVPQKQTDMDLLKRNIFSNPAYDGILVSEDGTAGLIFTEFKENVSYEKCFKLLQSIRERYSDGDTSVHIVGFPMLMGWIYSLKSQIFTVFGISIGLMILIIIGSFRSFAGVVPPIVLGICTTLLGLGFIGWTGINFSPLTFVLAFLVGARKVSHAIQITSRYLEELHLNAYNKEKACYETIRTMSTPNIAGVLTDGAGFAVLYLAKIALMQQIAVIMTFWMVTIAAASLTPIICTYIPLKWASDILARSKYKKGWMDKLTTAMAKFSIGTGRLVIVGGVIVIMLFSIWQSASLKVGDPTPGTPLLWPNHTYNQDQELINKEFKASSETFTLYYDGEAGSVYDSEVMTTFEKFDGYMQNNLPDIYKSSTSIINLTKMLNLTFHDGDQYFYQLPREDDELAGILGYVRQKTGSAAVRRYLDSELERAQITLFFADHTTDNMLRIRKTAYQFFEEHPQKTSKGEFKLAGGSIGLNMALNEEMKSSHALIDGIVLAAIFLMCSFFFRSFVAGLMLTLPLLVANMGAYAYMGLMNIGLSVNTLPVAAVGVGVGVDFAIYLYSRCIEEYQNCKDWPQTIITAVSTCGKAIVFTGLTLILAIIPWYFLSDLKFQAQMGFFLSMLLFINVVLALTIHPILLMWIKPKFVTRAKVKGL